MLVMRRHQRVDGGRLEPWKAALDHLGENRALVAQVAAVVLDSAVVINVPFAPGNTHTSTGQKPRTRLLVAGHSGAQPVGVARRKRSLWRSRASVCLAMRSLPEYSRRG
jgi:hypothetical protein